MAPERLRTRLRKIWYPWYALGVFTLVYAFNFIDRQILAILAEDIKRARNLNDGQLGFLFGTAFAIFYCLFGMPLGRLADNWRRGWLIGIGLAVWSSMTIFSGLSRNFGELAISRIGVGVGEASAGPAAFSLIADFFPKARRGLAASIYTAGLFMGMGAALPIGALTASSWNHAYRNGGAPLGLAGWQAAFLVVGLPGLLLAAWVTSLREPLRGESDGLAGAVVRPGVWREFGRDLMGIMPPLTLLTMMRIPGGLARNLVLLVVVAVAATLLAVTSGDVPQWAAFGVGVYAVGSWAQGLKHSAPAMYELTWGSRAFVLAACAFGTTTFVATAAGFWGTPYALRTFYPSPQSAARFLAVGTAREEVAYFGMVGTVLGALGVVIGGWLSDRWKARDPRGRIAVGVLSVCLYTPLLLALYTTHSPTVFFIVSPLLTGSLSLYVGAGFAVLQDLVSPGMRATASALGALATTMLGLALGPYFAGKVAAVTGSLGTGMISLVAMAPITVLLFWLASRSVASAEATLADRASEAIDPAAALTL